MIFFFLSNVLKVWRKKKSCSAGNNFLGSFLYAVKLIRKHVVSAVRAAHRSRMLEELPWSIVHVWRLPINMAVVHERPFMAWCACQMVYKSRSSWVLQSRPLQAILLWQYGDWPLSWAACAEPLWARLAETPALKEPTALCSRSGFKHNLQGSSCSHFIMCLLEESPPIKWTWLFNPDLCLRNATWNTIANLFHDLGTGIWTLGSGVPWFYILLSLIY